MNKMKGLCLLLILALAPLWGQQNSEVFLVEMEWDGREVSFASAKNISNNPGYDNQPSFYDQDALLYSRTVDTLTEIAFFRWDDQSTSVINKKNDASEYSPQLLPNSKNIVAVREKDGEQRLTVFDKTNGAVQKEIFDRQVGYFAFYDENLAIATVLSGNGMDLYGIDIKRETDTLLLKDVGRSLQKPPRAGMLSYSFQNENQNYDVYLLDMETYESYYVCELPVGVQDYTWLDRDQILIGSRDQLFVYDTFGKQEWEEVARFEDLGIEKITRLAVSPNGKFLAFAADIYTDN